MLRCRRAALLPCYSLFLLATLPLAGKEGDDNEEDTYDMLRKLVQLQRMTGQNGGSGQVRAV